MDKVEGIAFEKRWGGGGAVFREVERNKREGESALTFRT